tara:strand:+ start:64 stop:255 length:192 start_codon:yes stop_codon:yes gene_type:complete
MLAQQHTVGAEDKFTDIVTINLFTIAEGKGFDLAEQFNQLSPGRFIHLDARQCLGRQRLSLAD